MYCIHCGAENPSGAGYCRACGQPLSVSRRPSWPLAPEDAVPIREETVRAGPVAPPAVLVSEMPKQPAPAVIPPVSELPRVETPAPAAERAAQDSADALTVEKKPKSEAKPSASRRFFSRQHREHPPKKMDQLAQAEHEETREETPKEAKPAFLQSLVVWLQKRREQRQLKRAERLAQQKKEQLAAQAEGTTETAARGPAIAESADSGSARFRRPRFLQRGKVAGAAAAVAETEEPEFSEEQLLNLLFFPSSDDDPAVWGESPENLEKKRSSDIDAKKVAQIALIIGAGAVVIILVAEFAFT